MLQSLFVAVFTVCGIVMGLGPGTPFSCPALEFSLSAHGMSWFPLLPSQPRDNRKLKTGVMAAAGSYYLCHQTAPILWGKLRL